MAYAQVPPNKLATFNRQKAIQLMEKITKNLFRMFRDESTTKEQIEERFFHLKKQLDDLGELALNADYHRDLRVYIDNCASTLSGHYVLDDIRWPQMTKLNRLQKIKNSTEYKRDKSKKHKNNKSRRQDEYLDV